MGVFTIFFQQILSENLPKVETCFVTGGSINKINYNIVITSNALFRNKEGDNVVWVIESRNTPTGERCLVRESKVSVVTSEGATLTVEAAFAVNRTEIVSFYEEELKNGSQVRKQE